MRSPRTTGVRPPPWRAEYADPVAGKLVTYYRLLTRGAATAAEIDGFMRSSPDWPQQPLLETRWEQALVEEADPATLVAQCHGRWPEGVQALLRCTDAFAGTSDPADASEAARRAWTATGLTDPAQIAVFLGQWGSQIRPEDNSARFVALARKSSPAAGAISSGLPPLTSPLPWFGWRSMINSPTAQPCWPLCPRRSDGSRDCSSPPRDTRERRWAIRRPWRCG